MAQASHKRRKKAAARSGSPVPGWLWLVIGLLIGLSVAAYFYLQGRPVTAAAPAEPAAPPPATPSAKKSSTAKPKSQDAAAAKPRFDFYTILPEMEVVVPDAPKSGRSAPSATDKPAVYLLQVGSFRAYPEADNLKAQLALLGVESRIETVSGGDKDTWHRVRVGPYTDPREVNKIRTRLLNNNINAILLQIKG